MSLKTCLKMMLHTAQPLRISLSNMFLFDSDGKLLVLVVSGSWENHSDRRRGFDRQTWKSEVARDICRVSLTYYIYKNIHGFVRFKPSCVVGPINILLMVRYVLTITRRGYVVRCTCPSPSKNNDNFDLLSQVYWIDVQGLY